MSREWMLKNLINLGFTKADAEVYVSLTQYGSQKARDIAETLKTYRTQVYRSLKNLQAKGVVNASTDRPAQFSAISFEKVLDLLIKASTEEAKRVEQDKNELLTKWQSLIKEKA